MAGKNDIDLKASVEGAEAVKRKLRGLGDATKGMGNDVKKGHEKAGDAADKHEKKMSLLNRMFGRFTKGAMAWLGGIVAFVTAIRIATGEIREHFRHISETAEKATKNIQAQRDLLFLGDFYKKHPQLEQELQSLAESGRLGEGGRAQAARAYEMIVSKMPYAPERQRMDILQEIMEYKRTAGAEVSLRDLADVFVFMQQAAPAAQANQLQNVLQEAVTLGGAPTVAYAQYMSRILGTGREAELTLPQTVGLFATATRVEPEPATAATGLNRMMNILRGKEVPEGAATVLQQLGITQQMPLMEQLGRFYQGYQSGRVRLPQISEVFGMYAGPLMAKMIPAFPQLLQTQRRLAEVYMGGAEGMDLTAEMLEDMRAQNEFFKIEEDIRLLETQKEGEILDKDAMEALQIKRNKLKHYLELRKWGKPHWYAHRMAWMYGVGEGFLGPREEFEPLPLTSMPTPITNDSHDTYVITNVNPQGQPEQQAEPAVPPLP